MKSSRFLGLDLSTQSLTALVIDLSEAAVVFHASVDFDDAYPSYGTSGGVLTGEDPKVVNAIGAHHNDVEPQSLEAVVVQIADAISASRPGARRETLDNYLKRLESLEKIAEGFQGVDKAYAIQAGREVRIMVNNDEVDDEGAKSLAKNIAKKIESEVSG